MKVKKTESKEKPNKFRIDDKKGNLVQVTFFDGIEEITKDEEKLYAYYEYPLKLVYRENIDEYLTTNCDICLELAKNKFIEEKSAEIRKIRNELLDESDKELLIDRIDITDIKDISNNKWAIYRQKLRDITKQENFPYEVEFPTKPEE